VPVYGINAQVSSPGKQPAGTGWQNAARANPPACSRLPVSPGATNTGILCDGLRPLDIDIDDPAAADEIERIACDLFGSCPVRFRTNSGKRTLLYRASEGEPSKRVLAGTAGKIEVLGRGQQFVAFGMHPSNAVLEWRGGEPGEVRLADLPAVSEDEITQFLDAVRSIVGADAPAGRGDIDIPITEQKQSITSQSTRPAVASGQSDFFRIVNDRALSNIGAWVTAIFPGARHHDGTGAYRITSKQLGRALQEDLSISPEGIVDFGVADMGDARQGKRTPIDIVIDYGIERDAVSAAGWMCDRLGVDPDAIWKRNDALPVLDPSPLLKGRLRVVESIDAPEEGGDDEGDDEGSDGAPLDEDLTRVPGLLGDMIEAMVSSARRPSRRLALAAALPILGTVIGRRVAGPTRSGTHLYVIPTASTGVGKQHYLNAVERFMSAAGLGRHIGPSQFMSFGALNNFVESAPLSICPQDEFGAIIKKISHPRASGHETMISGTLRSLWGASFETVRTPAYASTRSVELHCPAMSLFAPTTPEELFEGMKGRDLVNGFMNRFLVIDAGERSIEREPSRDLRKESERLAPILSEFYRLGSAKRGNLSAHVDKNGDPDPEPSIVVPWKTQAAHDDYLALSAECERRRDEDSENGALYARTAEMAIRIATIRACSEDREAPMITETHVAWAARICIQSAELLCAAADRHMVDPLGAAEFERKVLEKLRRSPNRRMKMRTLYLAMSKNQRYAGDLEKTLKALAGAGIVELRKVQVPGGTSTYVAMP